MSKHSGRTVPEIVESEVQVKVFQDSDYCHVTLVDARSGAVIGMGNARRDPRDEPNLDIGGSLATARAFFDVARKAAKRADGMIKHADEVQQAKRAAKGELTDEEVIAFFSWLFGEIEQDHDAVHPASQA